MKVRDLKPLVEGACQDDEVQVAVVLPSGKVIIAAAEMAGPGYRRTSNSDVTVFEIHGSASMPLPGYSKEEQEAVRIAVSTGMREGTMVALRPRDAQKLFSVACRLMRDQN